MISNDLHLNNHYNFQFEKSIHCSVDCSSDLKYTITYIRTLELFSCQLSSTIHSTF